MQLTSAEDVAELLERYSKQAKALREEVIRICWWMRGSISYNEGFQLSNLDKELIAKVIEQNIEDSKKSGQLLY